MTYTDRDRDIARGFSDEQLELLARLVADRYAWEELSERNGVVLDDARYGQIMKVNYLTKEHAKGVVARIKKLAERTDKKSPAVAPR